MKRNSEKGDWNPDSEILDTIRAPENAWYMIGWASEFKEKPLTRKILGQDIVAFRKSDGTIAAMVDRCPHRFASLSMGTIVNDTIRCAYHGLQFDGSGQCVKQFFPGKPPSNARTRAFPATQRDTIVWLWMGDPALQDEELIPKFPYLVDPAYKSTSGLSMVRAHYQLIADNLMDLSHAEFIHPAFMGALRSGKHSVVQTGSTVESNWTAASVPPTFVINLWWPENGGIVDFWLDMRWNAPASMVLEVGSTRPGRPRAEGFHQPSVHILTPETDQTTHYFWNGGIAADHPQDMDELHALTVQVFDNEDAPVIEAVQRNMRGKSLDEMKPIFLPADAGAIRTRRVIAAMLDKERVNRQPATEANPAEPAAA